MDGVALTMRLAREEDLPGLLRLKNEEHLHRERLEMSAMLPDLPYFVLLFEGRVAGFCQVALTRPESSAWPRSEREYYPFLMDLVVDPASRGQGLGTRFLRALEQEVAARGFDRVYLECDPRENARVFQWYQRMGYVQLPPGARDKKFWRDTPENPRWTEFATDMVHTLDAG